MNPREVEEKLEALIQLLIDTEIITKERLEVMVAALKKSRNPGQ